MIEFIMTNLQTVFMAGAALLGGIYMLTGFERQPTEDGETQIRYQDGRMWRNIAVCGLLVGLAATAAFVPKGYVGVVYDWNGGIQQEERPEGLNFVFPFKQHVTNVDTRVKAWTFNDENVYVHTQDFHEIRVPFTINYRINPSEAAHVLQTVSGDPAETILSHAALNSVRTEVGSVVLDKLAQEVSTVAQAVEATIRPQAEANGLLVQYVAIEDTVVDQAYTQAVRDERISERNIRTAANNVLVAENEALAQSHVADGIRFIGNAEADVARELAAAVTNDVVQYELAKQGVRYLPTTLVSDAVDILLTPPSINE